MWPGWWTRRSDDTRWERFHHPDDVRPIVDHATNCLCVRNADGSCRAIELRCVVGYLVQVQQR
jgi:hypothetical protein